MKLPRTQDQLKLLLVYFPLTLSLVSSVDAQQVSANSDNLKRQSKAIHYDNNIFIDAPETPQIIEIFDSRNGPSSMLLERRLLGLKVLSLPLEARSTRDMLKTLNLLVAPQVMSVNDKEHLLFPLPMGNDPRANKEMVDNIDYRLPELGEFAAKAPSRLESPAKIKPPVKSENEIAIQNNQFDGWPKIIHTGLASIMFDGRGGHLGASIVPLTPLAHTWFYQNQNKFTRSKESQLGQALSATVLETVKALNSDLLDTRSASSKLVGEAKLTGTSIKAGCEIHPGLGKFSKLKENQFSIRQLSEKCAVVRVPHMSGGAESYFYLVNEKGWKVSAIRTPLEAKKFAPGLDPDEPSPDENWNRSEAKRKVALTPAQRAMSDAFDSARSQAARRSLMTDREIRMWFKQHQGENIVAKQAMADLEVGTSQPALVFYSLNIGYGDTTSSITCRLRSLELSAAQKLKNKNVYLKFAPGRYSESGILYSEDDCPPPIGPYGTIWTEKLADHWYLMRVINEYQF